MSRYYVKGQEILANCGTREKPDWIPGVVTELLFSQYQPYEVKLERKSDGEDTWYFSAFLIIDDNRRNRKNKGLL